MWAVQCTGLVFGACSGVICQSYCGSVAAAYGQVECGVGAHGAAERLVHVWFYQVFSMARFYVQASPALFLCAGVGVSPTRGICSVRPLRQQSVSIGVSNLVFGVTVGLASAFNGVHSLQHCRLG